MVKYPFLIPECNVDTAFVEMLGYHEPNHAPNIHEVMATLEKLPKKQAAIGFIDNDKKRPPYLSNFKPLASINNIRLLKHSDLNQYLVVAAPAMDRLVFDLCTRLEIDPLKYKFPQQFKPFLER